MTVPMTLALLLAVPTQVQQPTVLFDGTDASQWVIEGPYTIEDGVLILGGETRTRMRPVVKLTNQWQMTLEMRTAGTCSYDISLRRFGSKGNAGGGLPNLDEWTPVTMEVQPNPGSKYDQFRVRCTKEDGTAHDHTFDLRVDPDELWLSANPGGKLYIRAASIRITPASFWRQYALPLAALISLGILVLVVVVVVRRMRAAARTEALPYPPELPAE